VAEKFTPFDSLQSAIPSTVGVLMVDATGLETFYRAAFPAIGFVE